MALRDFALNNFRWKVTALILALLVWFGIRLAMNRGATGGRYQVMRHRSVLVLKAPEDPRTFRVDPPKVDVVVQGTKELGEEDVEVFVNLTTLPDVNTAFKPVLVRAADSTKVHVEPQYVTVERVTPGEASLNKGLSKP